jgi:Aspartyl/Asparaginyl beta-hydroxylase
MLILKYLQLPFYFDAELLREAVDHLSGTNWQMHYQVRHYEGEWSAIPLRSPGGKADDIIVSPTDDTPYRDTIFLKSSPYLQQVLQTFKCPLKAVRLLKLNAGAVIKPHRDAELNYEHGEIRLHIPLVTHEDVEFYLDDERMQLKAGECWYMNFNLPHHINNRSTVNRIHLVIDAEVNDWVREIFNGPAITVKKEIEDTSMVHDAETKKQMIIGLRQMNTAVSNQMAAELEKELGSNI